MSEPKNFYPMICRTFRSFPNGELMFITATAGLRHRDPLAVWQYIVGTLGTEDAPSIKTMHLSCEWISIDVHVPEGEDVDTLRGRMTAWIERCVSDTPHEW